MESPTVPSDRDVVRTARDLLRRAERRAGSRWRNAVDPDARLLAWTTRSPAFKTNLFRFVDVFPACADVDDAARHLVEYLDGPGSPAVIRRSLGPVRGDLPGARRIATSIARRGIERMAARFIVGATTTDVVPKLAAAWADGFATTLDFLGEKTVTAADADAYTAKVLDAVVTLGGAAPSWPERLLLERDPWGRLGRANVSIKPTALSPHLGATSIDLGVGEAIDRLGPVLEEARRLGVTVHFDTEHDESKDAIFTLVRAIGDRWPDGPDLGCVVQAYRRDAEDDMSAIVAWSRRRVASGAAPLQVRLVKGAYWDAETIAARANGWPSPVWAEKADSDLNFEHLTGLLMSAAGAVRPAIASHNVRSIAYAATLAEAIGLPRDAWEVQVLHGMAEPLHAAVRDSGVRVRVYRPVGELVPGMSYLVRRLLENTANESFVRHGFRNRDVSDRDLASPAAAPSPAPAPAPAGTVDRRERTTSVATAVVLAPFVNEPPAELRRPAVRARCASATPSFGFEVPLLVGERRISTVATLDSLDPGRLSTRVCTSSLADAEHVDDAVRLAHGALRTWGSAEIEQRAAVLDRAASLIATEREALTMLIVHEAGKPLVEADADVAEAIDFLRYYARAACALVDRPLLQVPGERNTMRLRPRGVTAVIAPWNFPLAIPCGMVAGALVMGNPVVLKPAEQTPGVALRLVELMRAAGVPDDALHLLPGLGELVGPALVTHPLVANVVFTGSRAVGLEIVASAAVVQPGQRHIRRVVAEMGGKNAVIVDSDADLDVAVPAIAHGAFGYAGQKCSATSGMIGVGPGFDRMVSRLAGLVDVLTIGHPSDPAVEVGPVIDADAVARIARFRDLAATEGTIVAERLDLPVGGHYVGPVLAVVDDPAVRVATEEVFGPFLVALRAADLEHAIALADASDYALTGGVFSRSPGNVERVIAGSACGNLYVNRATTGAVVGRQPFGGGRLSGCGLKAGGPDYLLQFADASVVSENTLRQGFAPDLFTDRPDGAAG
ncbi:MAG: proline dehydrogenase family protein [Acidimicrobiia bacterium]